MLKIISGGQTGVDRAALDVALKHGIDCGGWCPPGRLDEFGKIPDRYPLKELEKGSFAERTLQNVKDSEGTVIVYFEELRGGTEFTLQCCKQLRCRHRLIDAAKTSVEDAAKAVLDFAGERKIEILNVAGPRQSEWPEGYDYVSRALDIFLTRSGALSPDRAARRSRRGPTRRASRSKTR